MTSPSVPLRRATPLPALPLRALAPYLVLAVVFLAVLYLLFVDPGVAALVAGDWLLEFAHDGRHLFGFPGH